MRQFSPNTFANFPIDKAGHHRKDPLWLADALAGGSAQLSLFHKGQPFLLEESGASAVRSVAWLAGAARDFAGRDPLTLFLGVDASGAPHFAVEAPGGVSESPLAGMGQFEDLRGAAMQLSAADASLMACAKALFEWHATHGFCSRCGHETQSAEGGWKRECKACGAEHFPRVDPVAIMLPVHPHPEHGPRCCLGRQARFPRGMYSALAGFIEPGESLEEACARELQEEAGLVTKEVRYHSTQPWPYPSQLMIGLIAEVESDALTLDQDEIVEAVWLTRAEARAALSGGLSRDGKSIWAPPALAIAHHLVKAWAEEAE
jgi:NAD+ diphosphatase